MTAEEQIAIIKDSRLSVDDRGYVALRFTTALEHSGALQMIYLEGPNTDMDAFNALIHAAGSIDRLDGLPVIIQRDAGIMAYKRPAVI